jgi:hypothetical protein
VANQPTTLMTVRLSSQRARLLHELAERAHITDEQMIERAISLLFAGAGILLGSQSAPGGYEPDDYPGPDAPGLDMEEPPFEPIEVLGKPLSEMIIEERR